MLINFSKGMLIEYALSLPPLALQFEFNPESLSRTRSVNIVTGNAPGTRGGYDFTLPSETPRVAQGVTPNPEQGDISILVDASDRMGDPNLPGHLIATEFGIDSNRDGILWRIGFEEVAHDLEVHHQQTARAQHLSRPLEHGNQAHH